MGGSVGQISEVIYLLVSSPTPDLEKARLGDVRKALQLFVSPRSLRRVIPHLLLSRRSPQSQSDVEPPSVIFCAFLCFFFVLFFCIKTTSS